MEESCTKWDVLLTTTINYTHCLASWTGFANHQQQQFHEKWMMDNIFRLEPLLFLPQSGKWKMGCLQNEFPCRVILPKVPLPWFSLSFQMYPLPRYFWVNGFLFPQVGCVIVSWRALQKWIWQPGSAKRKRKTSTKYQFFTIAPTPNFWASIFDMSVSKYFWASIFDMSESKYF